MNNERVHLDVIQFVSSNVGNTETNVLKV